MKNPHIKDSKNRPNVLITGATSGIGLEMAKILAKAGYNLVLTGRNEAKMKEIETTLQPAMEGTLTVVESDLGILGAGEELHEKCHRRGLTIDILINNAGNGFFGEHLTLPLPQLRTMLTCNTINLTELCSLFGTEMIKRKNGMILNIASTAAYQPLPYMAAYAASKSYVLNFSEALAKELEDDDVTVSCYSPGATATKFFASAGVAVANNKDFPVERYAPAHLVAQKALETLFSKKLSSVYGWYGRFTAFAVRLFPRAFVAAVTKRIMG